MARYFWLLMGLALGACSGGGGAQSAENVVGQKPAGEGRAKLWLSGEPKGEEIRLKVNFEKGTAPAPRVAEIRVTHPAELTLLSSAIGDSAKSAGKELTVQELGNSVVRLILLSRDGSSLDSGVLAELKLKKHGAGKVKVDILMDKPVFAPAESMQGLSIGDPLEL
jgi:hypothetical protein